MFHKGNSFAIFLPERQRGRGDGKEVLAKLEYFNDSIVIFIYSISEVFKPKFGQLDYKLRDETNRA